MMLDLPHEIATALAPLLSAWPPERAMDRLVVRAGVAGEALEAATRVMQQPLFQARPDLRAGLWLYVDELDRSHALSQEIHDATGSFWHGIMHRREGDFDNARYWMRRVRSHPATAGLAGYEAFALIDAAERVTTTGAHGGTGGGSVPGAGVAVDAVVATQRAEWAALFSWCARRAR